MKRKVQAQRKFAVGANIPNPNRQQPNIERRTENLNNDPKIIQIHSSPKSALDIVSFQAMHSHKQPYVLLERLNHEKHKMPLQQQHSTESDHDEKSSSSLPKEEVEESPHSSNDTPPFMDPVPESPHSSNDSPPFMDPVLDHPVKSSHSLSRQDTFDESPHSSNDSPHFMDPVQDVPCGSSHLSLADYFYLDERSTSSSSMPRDIIKLELPRSLNDTPSSTEPVPGTSKDFQRTIDQDIDDDIPHSSSHSSPTEYYYIDEPSTSSSSLPRRDTVRKELPGTLNDTPSSTEPVPGIIDLDSPQTFNPLEAEIKLLIKEEYNLDSPSEFLKQLIATIRTVESYRTNEEEGQEGTTRSKVVTPRRCSSQLFKSVKDIFLFRYSVLPERCKSCYSCSNVDLVLGAFDRLVRTIDQNSNCNIGSDDILEYVDLTKDIPDDGDIFNEKGKLLIQSNNLQHMGEERVGAQDVAASQPPLISEEPNAHAENMDGNVAITSENCPNTSDIRPDNKQQTSTPINETTTPSTSGSGTSRRKLGPVNMYQKDVQCAKESSRPSTRRQMSNTVNEDSIENHIEVQIATTMADIPSTSHQRSRTVSTSSDDEVLATRPVTRSGTRRRNLTCNIDQATNEKDVECPNMPSKRRRQKSKTRNVDRIEANKLSSHVGSRIVSNDAEWSATKKNCNLNYQEAPVFIPTNREFEDPVKYIESIMSRASNYGLCKVIPPKGFQPSCNLTEPMRFEITNQYISRMFRRRGPSAMELAAIKASHKVPFNRPPLLGGIEVDLPKLFDIVMSMGGLSKGFTSKKWAKVAEKLNCNYIKRPGPRLESIYVKYLLPYEMIALSERKQLIEKVSDQWNKREELMLKRAMNPLYRQKQMLGEEQENFVAQDFETSEDLKIFDVLAETEDCVVPGRSINLNSFKKVAENASKALLASSDIDTESIEKAYWDLIESGTRHVCVNAASIDTGVSSFGFPSGDDDDPYGLHPWNLKRLSKNTQNMLSFMGPVVGMTVPTLHLAMVFSTSCWHRDPHGLPWIEYMHEGAERVWYGTNEQESDNFRKAVESLCPLYCQNKSVWLPSDITMVPLKQLQQHNVSLCRAIQKPGEFIIVCPKAYSCSFATGFAVSESVYFATSAWIENISQVFQELRDSCEPSNFSLLQLLISFVNHARTPLKILKEIYPTFKDKIEMEINNRRELRKLGLRSFWQPKTKPRNHRPWNALEHDECGICRQTLFLSKGNGLFGTKTNLCSGHTLEALQKLKTPEEIKKSKVLTLEYIYSNNELRDLLSNLKDRMK